MTELNYQQLNLEQQRLLDAASSAMETAYNPYSRFYVGAALLTQDGQIITGSNVENSAYGSTICAERSALVRANAMNQRRFTSLAVIARGEAFDTTTITGPCGSCRQMIFEVSQISETDLEVILSTTRKDKIVVTTIKALLPYAFGPIDLGVDIEKYQQ